MLIIALLEYWSCCLCLCHRGQYVSRKVVKCKKYRQKCSGSMFCMTTFIMWKSLKNWSVSSGVLFTRNWQIKKPAWLCSVLLWGRQQAVEHERSVGENTRRSRVFLTTSWVLYHFQSALQHRTEHCRGFFICFMIKNAIISSRIRLNFQSKLYFPKE